MLFGITVHHLDLGLDLIGFVLEDDLSEGDARHGIIRFDILEDNALDLVSLLHLDQALVADVGTGGHEGHFFVVGTQNGG